MSAQTRSNAGARRRKIGWLLALVLLAVAGWLVFGKDVGGSGTKLKSCFKKAEKSVSNATGELVDAGKKAMPGDSAYKRNREKMLDD